MNPRKFSSWDCLGKSQCEHSKGAAQTLSAQVPSRVWRQEAELWQKLHILCGCWWGLLWWRPGHAGGKEGKMGCGQELGNRLIGPYSPPLCHSWFQPHYCLPVWSLRQMFGTRDTA